MRLINKDALVAELEKLRNNAWESFQRGNSTEEQYYLRYGVTQDILSLINNFEVKEVDLEKEIDNYIYTNNGRQRLALELDWKQCNITFNGGKLIDFAKHFFELGLKVQKGE